MFRDNRGKPHAGRRGRRRNNLQAGSARRVIYTTNAIEAVNRELRKVIKTRGSFPNDEAALKLLHLAVQNLSKQWTRPVANWPPALNCLAILFEGRVPIF